MEATSNLETTIDNLFDWFCYNNFIANPSNCHLFSSPFNYKSINIKSSSIEGSSRENFLGEAIDSNFTIEKHKNELYRTGNQMLRTLTGYVKYMSTKKRGTLFKAVVVSQIQLLSFNKNVPYKRIKESD